MKWKQIGSGAAFAIGMLYLGFATGGVIGSRMTSPGGMGWDRLADMLGGMMIGVVIAVGATGAMVTRLTPRQRMIAAGICIVLSSVVLTFMQRMPGPSP